jgi:hypothetical protein
VRASSWAAVALENFGLSLKLSPEIRPHFLNLERHHHNNADE